MVDAEQLARRATEGARGEEREKLHRWYLTAYRVALGSVPGQDVDDVVQESVLELVRREKAGVEPGPGLVYLVCKSVVHSYYDQARGRRIEDRSYRAEAGELGEAPDEDQALAALEERLAAEEILAALPAKVATIVLRFAQGEKLPVRERMVLSRMRKEIRQLVVT